MSNFKMTDEQFDRLVKMNFGTPPGWCKGAIATNSGWVNPRTKEVLFASAGLARRIQEFEEEKARRSGAKKDASFVSEPKVVEEPKVEVKAEEVKPVEKAVEVKKEEPAKVEEPKVIKRWVADANPVEYVDAEEPKTSKKTTTKKKDK